MVNQTPSMKILLVEDSATQAAHLRHLLEEGGFAVTVAVDGHKAYDAIGPLAPDLVVTDLHMPEMNGLELVGLIKGEYPHLPVILTTAEGSEDIATDALSKGASSYVPKRRASAMLVDTVRQILSLLEADRTAKQLLKFQIKSEITYSLTNETSIVPAVIARLNYQLEQMKICGESQLMCVAMALDESLLNAMIHGNLEVSSELREAEEGNPYRDLIVARQQQPEYADRKVHLRLTTTRNEACFVVRDEGPGFDPAEIPDPRDPANLEKLSGRGLLLIQTFMDEVRHNDRGNEITMIKRRPAIDEATHEK